MLRSALPDRQIVGVESILGVIYSTDAEIRVLLQLLENLKLIEQRPNAYVLSIDGILAVEGMEATGGDHSQGFVAIWFDPAFDIVWTNGFEPAIREAGYRPFRIDKKEYVGAISDQIISEIRRSRFVVADYTEQINGVYFEAGLALGLGLTVIPTCRVDQVGKLHFDIRHLNTLLWNTPEELSTSLSKRIVAILGSGPSKLRN